MSRKKTVTESKAAPISGRAKMTIAARVAQRAAEIADNESHWPKQRFPLMSGKESAGWLAHFDGQDAPRDPYKAAGWLARAIHFAGHPAE